MLYQKQNTMVRVLTFAMWMLNDYFDIGMNDDNVNPQDHCKTEQKPRKKKKVYDMSSSSWVTSSPILGRQLGRHLGIHWALILYPLRTKNWSLDPIIRDACAGETFENIFLISVIVTFANFSLI